MHYDDRLATVLRSPAGGERAARTQFRQLLDLLGSARADRDNGLAEAAYVRLEELNEAIPALVRAQILREPGLRLRNPRLIEWLAAQDGQVAASAMATARLTEAEWLAIIPRLPVSGRGFLRHRRDLPENIRQLLVRLGVGDLVLPEPERPEGAVPAEAGHIPETKPGTGDGIGALVRRIEEFRKAREEREERLPRDLAEPQAPHLPFLPGDEQQQPHHRLLSAFDFSTDAQGRIKWADPAAAPMAVGLSLASRAPHSPVALPEEIVIGFRRRQPFGAQLISITGAPAIDGEWVIDAAPGFAPDTGAFLGYRGRMRRPLEPAAGEDSSPQADLMRQMLHEMRTPVNAIQGFAEIIQQQIFGPAPNEYRALAAAIAVDAARLLAGFEELDRMARLETGTADLRQGESDLREVVAITARRLEGAMKSRSAGFQLAVAGPDFHVGMAREEAMQLAWRILATLAGRIAPGERLELALASDGSKARLRVELPASLSGEDDLFSRSDRPAPGAVSAGMFGSGFTLRLARDEARAAGGTLEKVDGALLLELPLLTPGEATNSPPLRKR